MKKFQFELNQFNLLFINLGEVKIERGLGPELNPQLILIDQPQPVELC